MYARSGLVPGNSRAQSRTANSTRRPLYQEREGREQERHARRNAERRIAYLEREIQGLREARREVPREISPPVPVRSSEDVLETGRLSREKPLPTRKAREAGRTLRPESFPETSPPWESTEGSPKNKRSRRGVWMPHPDDDTGQGEAPTERDRTRSDAPVKMFRKHYDKYLENYEGYVKLAERIYKSQDDAAMVPGSLAQREWEERLRRVNDGIKRTTARLDILEEYNPELATDDRISRRANIALSHSELERSRQVSRNT
jgi:hypothetical protein